MEKSQKKKKLPTKSDMVSGPGGALLLEVSLSRMKKKKSDDKNHWGESGGSNDIGDTGKVIYLKRPDCRYL